MRTLRQITNTPHNPHTTKHPWEKWFNGHINELTQGEDFTCTTASIRTLAYNRARKMGGTVKTSLPHGVNGTTIEIQFTPDN
jgi:hypothetical protein